MFHDRVVDRSIVDAVVGLHDEHVGAAHGFTEAATHFTVGELDEIVAADFDVEMLGHLLSECRVGTTRVESEALGGDLFHVEVPGDCVVGWRRGLPDGGSVERAGRRVRKDCGTRRQMHIRTDDGVVADLGAVADAVFNDGAGADCAVGEACVGAQLAAVTDDGRSLQHGAGVQRDVATDGDVHIDERLARVEHRDAVEEPVAVGAVAQLTFGERKLPPVVDALGLGSIGLHRADTMAHAGQSSDDIGEVVLALSVVGGEVAQRRAEQVAAETQDAGVPLFDVEFVGRGVALFDDASDLAVFLADDPAISGRVVEHAGQEGARVLVGDMGGDQLVERVGLEQGSVAGQDDDGGVVVVIVAVECRHADGCCIARTVLFELLDERHVGPGRRALGDLFRDGLSLVTDHDGGASRLEFLKRMDHVEHHGAPTNEVERLRATRSHARAFPSSEDNCGNTHGSGGRNRTPILGTKNRCLAVRRPRSGSVDKLPEWAVRTTDWVR